MSYKFKVSEKLKNIILFEFEDLYELCMTMVRIQEFYESDNEEFRGKFFFLEDYMHWYAHNKGNGVFTYPEEWNGFNVPGKILGDWMNIFIKNSPAVTGRTAEGDLYRAISDLRDKDPNDLNIFEYLDNKYIIAIHDNEEEEEKYALRHELTHAFYYLYPEYKTKCKKLIYSLPKQLKLEYELMLIESGYHKEVILDEMQAYLTDGSGEDDKIKILLNEDFKKNFDEFYKKLAGEK